MVFQVKYIIDVSYIYKETGPDDNGGCASCADPKCMRGLWTRNSHGLHINFQMESGAEYAHAWAAFLRVPDEN